MSETIKQFPAVRESIGVGSIVELKSGGPPMTVKSRTADEANVIFHNADGEILTGTVPLNCLKVRG
jgi:hypothetical protein